MANITRKVSRGIPAPRQYWTSTDNNDSGVTMATGDVFKLNDSLNGPATEVILTTTTAGTMSFRTNSILQLFPRRPTGEWQYGENELLIASGVLRTDQSQTAIVLNGNSSMILTGPINDLEICSISGAFTLRAKR